jgi:hypothetical protein
MNKLKRFFRSKKQDIELISKLIGSISAVFFLLFLIMKISGLA